MIVSIHQPSYIPYLGYFYKMVHCDQFVYLDDAQYEKNGFINRNRIKVSNREELIDRVEWLTIPVKTKGRLHQSIKDVEAIGIDWAQNHIDRIKEAYLKAPFYEEYITFVKNIIRGQAGPCLNVYNVLLSNETYCLIMGNLPEWSCSSWYNIKGLKSTARLVEICKQLGADTYLAGPGGKDYMDMSLFEKANIKVVFSEFKVPEYRQLGKEFISNLSVLDALFNIGAVETRKILEG